MTMHGQNHIKIDTVISVSSGDVLLSEKEKNRLSDQVNLFLFKITLVVQKRHKAL